MSSSVVHDIVGLVVDNPIIRKDGLLVLRRKKTLLALGLAALGVALASVLIWLDDATVVQWNPDYAVGRALLSIMLGLAFLAAGVLLPAAASSTLAGEREHGTLPLLMVTGLSPARIVVGKIVAMLVLAAPFVALPLPSMLVAAAAIGVDPLVVMTTLLGLATSMVAFAAVGVYASAMTDRSRTAAPAALVFAAIPAIFCAAPAFGIAVDAADGHLRDREIFLALGGLVAGAVVAVAATWGAWSALAPRSAPRFKGASLLFVVVSVGMPLAAVALTMLMDGRPGGVDVGLWAGAGLFSAAAVLLFSAGVGRDARAPTPMLVVPVAVATAVATLAAASLAMSRLAHDGSMLGDQAASAAFACVQLLAASAAAALAGRFIKSPLLAAAAGGSAVLVVALIPKVLDEVLTGPPPLTFLNFAYLAGADELAPALLLWAAVSAGCLFFARRRPA